MTISVYKNTLRLHIRKRAFFFHRINQPLWNYEDMTAKVWWVRSAEQLTVLLRHVLRVFRDSLPHALVSQRWAQTALQLGLSCSSRHYAGRSLQVFRALRVPITSRMLSDILSRLVETVAEQGEDMQVSKMPILVANVLVFFCLIRFCLAKHFCRVT